MAGICWIVGSLLLYNNLLRLESLWKVYYIWLIPDRIAWNRMCMLQLLMFPISVLVLEISGIFYSPSLFFFY